MGIKIVTFRLSVMDRNRIWTQEEIDELHRLRSLGLEWSEIAVRLGRTRKAVEHKIYNKPIRRVATRGRQLTEKELAWVIRHYKHTKNEEIMERFELSHSSLHRIAREHGLTKSRHFMKKTQDEAQVAAAESHRRNGTYPPKGFRIPGSDKNCFKKGQSNQDRLTPKRYAEMQEKRRASWRATYDRDKRRTLAWGFEQRTKFRFVKQSRSKIAFRHGLRKCGYVEDPNNHNLYYYTSEHMRRPKRERNASKYGIKIIALETYETT